MGWKLGPVLTGVGSSVDVSRLEVCTQVLRRHWDSAKPHAQLIIHSYHSIAKRGKGLLHVR